MKLELKDSLAMNKRIYYDIQKRIEKSINTRDSKINNSIFLIEKSPEYIQYKSNLIRLILIDYAHFYPNGIGKELLDKIIDKWNLNKSISDNKKKIIYERTISNIIAYEKIINNIEEIMMLISIHILEYFYE